MWFSASVTTSSIASPNSPTMVNSMKIQLFGISEQLPQASSPSRNS